MYITTHVVMYINYMTVNIKGPIFMVAQRPAEAVLEQFGNLMIILMLKLILPFCTVFWIQAQNS